MADFRAQVYEHYLSSQKRQDDLLGSRRAFFYQIIQRHFPPARNAAILDLACGYGALILFARERGYRCISGIDVSPEQVDSAARLGIDGVNLGNAMEVAKGLPTNSLDVITSFDLLEHLDKSDVFDLAREVLRALRPGGRWILHTVNGESPMAGAVLFGDLTHQQAFTRKSMTQLLKAIGFDEMQFYEDSPSVHGLTSAARWIIWKFVRTAIALWAAAETGSGAGIFSQNFLTVAIKH